MSIQMTLNNLSILTFIHCQRVFIFQSALFEMNFEQFSILCGVLGILLLSVGVPILGVSDMPGNIFTYTLNNQWV